MKNVVVTGRIVPERALVQFPAIEFQFEIPAAKGRGKICCQMSLVSCVMNFEQEVSNIIAITSISKEVASNISNLISLQIAGSYFIALDLLVDLESGQNYPIPTREPVFPSTRTDFKFTPVDDHAPVQIQQVHLQSLPLTEAISELSLALQRPHLTQMHCRRAIEAVRWHFEPQDEGDERKRESLGWERLRAALNFERADIEAFKDHALNQRHGRRTDNSWEARKNAMQVTFEVIDRFMKRLLQ